jgi:peptide/nickel transport system permease protein
MIKYIIIRSLELLPVLFIISIISFSIAFMTPIDPAKKALMFSGYQDVPDEQVVEDFRVKMGLDQPLYIQYINWLNNVVEGNFGYSLKDNCPVLDKVINCFINTLKLSVFGMLITLAIGIPLGVVSAMMRGTIVDMISRFIAIFNASFPSFWLAYMLIIIFALTLNVVPVAGYGGGDLSHMILPAFTLGIICSGTIIRLTRSSMLEVLEQEYIRGARAKGLQERAIIVRHALKNAMIPVVTYCGMTFASLLSGAAITEVIFAWPGIGNLIVTAIQNKDFPLIQGCVLFISFVYLMINFVVDLSYVYLNPRIRYESKN